MKARVNDWCYGGVSLNGKVTSQVIMAVLVFNEDGQPYREECNFNPNEQEYYAVLFSLYKKIATKLLNKHPECRA